MTGRIFTTGANAVDNFGQNAVVNRCLQTTFDACVGALILSAGLEIQIASLVSHGWLNWKAPNPTRTRPLNSACAVAKLLLAGIGGIYLAQGCKALPNLNAAMTPMAFGIIAFGARYYADSIAREIDRNLF